MLLFSINQSSIEDFYLEKNLYNKIMRQDLKKHILYSLFQQSDYIQLQFLATKWHTSKKTILKYMHEIKEEVEQYGASLETKTGLGTKLYVHDAQRFQQYLRYLQKQEVTLTPWMRKQMLLATLLLAKHPINAYDLSQDIYVSASFVRKLLNELEEELKQNQLELVHHHKDGYQIIGQEKDIRRCFLHVCHDILFVPEVFEQIRHPHIDATLLEQLIVQSLHRYAIEYTKSSLHSLVLHLLLAIHRITTNHPIAMVEIYHYQSIVSSVEYFVSVDIFKQLSKQMMITIPQSEQLYFAMQLNSKQRVNLHEYLKVTVSQEALVFYNRFLRQLLKQFQIDLFDDVALRKALLYHIVPFLVRFRNGMMLDHCELSDLSIHFMYAYYLTYHAITNMQEYGQINQAEIAYFALHLAVCFEKQPNQHLPIYFYPKPDPMIQQLFMMKIYQEFADEQIPIYFQTEKEYLQNGIYLTTLPDSTDHYLPISLPLKPKDIENIRHYMPVSQVQLYVHDLDILIAWLKKTYELSFDEVTQLENHLQTYPCIYAPAFACFVVISRKLSKVSIIELDVPIMIQKQSVKTIYVCGLLDHQQNMVQWQWVSQQILK